MDGLKKFLERLRDAWNFYQGLSPNQQHGVLLLAVIGVTALVVWIAYQVHGDRVVVVLPAGVLRITLLLLVLPFVLLGKATGRGTAKNKTASGQRRSNR